MELPGKLSYLRVSRCHICDSRLEFWGGFTSGAPQQIVFNSVDLLQGLESGKRRHTVFPVSIFRSGAVRSRSAPSNRGEGMPLDQHLFLLTSHNPQFPFPFPGRQTSIRLSSASSCRFSFTPLHTRARLGLVIPYSTRHYLQRVSPLLDSPELDCQRAQLAYLLQIHGPITLWSGVSSIARLNVGSLERSNWRIRVTTIAKLAYIRVLIDRINLRRDLVAFTVMDRLTSVVGPQRGESLSQLC